jgi:hypothetical protein
MQYARAVLFYHLPPLRLYQIFPHYLINGTFVVKKVTEHKIVF